ncbi:MAG: binding-protein-dependent transport system inner rane component [Acidimicrobiales bacterium]|nr:binding-protein-dependent transport system inner rane component [Acidimicrobiales bacterium]
MTAPPSTIAPPPPRKGIGRRASRVLSRHPRLELASLLGAPLTWLVLVYLGSLAALLVTALYTTDPFTGNLVHTTSTTNLHELVTNRTLRVVTQRTVGVAFAVTVIDLALALPIAFFMAKVASPRTRRALAVAIVLPLWASYLVKAYCWRVILDPEGGVLRKAFGVSPGFGVSGAVVVLAYLWLPYMVLPIYAGLEKLPNSLLDAAGDLGSRPVGTFRSVVLPLLKPAILAGAVFTFSLSLGDYITVQIVGGKAQLIGNVVYRDFGAGLIPGAAAFAIVPILIMVAFLLIVRRSGALENL